MSRLRRGLAILLLGIGITLFFLGIRELYRVRMSSLRYERLADDYDGLPKDHSEGDGSPDSDDVTRFFEGDMVAWVTVDGIGVDLPVATGSHGFSWYLNHDLWGNESELGCPFLDPRCPSTEAPHVLVYGHHMSFTNVMFSPLHRCYRQDAFDTLGECTWTTTQGTTMMVPLCALSVDQDYADILRFSFRDDEDLRQWISNLVDQASARADNAHLMASRSTRILTLVTCSSEISGQRWRTLVLFCT